MATDFPIDILYTFLIKAITKNKRVRIQYVWCATVQKPAPSANTLYSGNASEFQLVAYSSEAVSLA